VFTNRAKWLKVLALIALLAPALCFGSVESTLGAMQAKLIGVILPGAAILGLVFAGLSFLTGNPSARQHLTLAMIGAIVGFGAPSIVAFIRGVVQ